jgi:hypothetical protein
MKATSPPEERRANMIVLASQLHQPMCEGFPSPGAHTVILKKEPALTHGGESRRFSLP